MALELLHRLISESVYTDPVFETGSVTEIVPFKLTSNIGETEFDDTKRTAVVTVIQQGWSKNGFFYTPAALEDIKNHLNSTATKVYMNHNPKEDPFRPRLVEDHIADSLEAWVEGATVKSRAKFFETGPHSFIFGRMQEAKHSLGPSIVGKATVRKGEAEGIRGNIVQRVDFLHSYDMVSQPAAGGAVDEIFETVIYSDSVSNTPDSSESLEDLDEGIKETIARTKQRRESSRKYWDVEMAFDSAVRGLVLAEGDFEFISVKERRDALPPLMEEYATEIAKIKFVEPRPIPKRAVATTDEAQEGISEGYRLSAEGDKKIKATSFGSGEFENNSFRTVSVSKAKGISAMLGTLKGGKGVAVRAFVFDKGKGWTETKVKNYLSQNSEAKVKEPIKSALHTHGKRMRRKTKEGVDMEGINNLIDLKAADPVLYEAFVQESNTNAENQEKFKQYKADSEKLTGVETKLTESEKSVTELEDKVKTLGESVKTLEEAKKEFETATQGVTAKGIVVECKKEIGISEEYCGEDFDNELAAIAFESADKYKEAVTTKIKARKAFAIKLSGGKIVEGVGNIPTSENALVSEGSKGFMNNSEALAKRMKKVS